MSLMPQIYGLQTLPEVPFKAADRCGALVDDGVRATLAALRRSYTTIETTISAVERAHGWRSAETMARSLSAMANTRPSRAG
jgi:hypothetical protein